VKSHKHSEKLQVLAEPWQGQLAFLSLAAPSAYPPESFHTLSSCDATQTPLSAPSQQPLKMRATSQELWEEVETAGRIRAQGCHDELLPCATQLSPHPWAAVRVLLSILAHQNFYFTYQRVAESFWLISCLPPSPQPAPGHSWVLCGFSICLLTHHQQQCQSGDAEYLPPMPTSHAVLSSSIQS